MDARIVEVMPDFIAEIENCETLEDFVTTGIAINRQKTHSQWCLGLLALKVQSIYGEQSLSTFAKNISVSVSSLQSYRWTVKSFLEESPDFIPPEIVPFGILQVAAKLPTEEKIKMVESVANGEVMTIERARIESKKIQGKESEIKPKFHTEFCKEHKKWIFLPEKPEEWEENHD